MTHIFITAALIIICTVALATVLNVILRRLIVQGASKIGSKVTTYKFIKHFIVAAVYVIGFGFAASTFPELRNLGASMLAGAGLLTVVVGLAAQQALANVIAGIFIVLFRPYQINDRISLKKDYTGVVEDINLRHTVIRNYNSQRIIVPNSIMSSEILVNSDFIEDKVCKWVEIGISYNSSIDLAKSIMRNEIENHPLNIDTRTPEAIEEGTPKVLVRVLRLDESQVTIRAWAWAKDSADAFELHCDVLESIKKRFDKEGVEIPYPHRVVYTREEEKN